MTAQGRFLKVYLNRGFIGLPESVRDAARVLGLTRRYQTVYLEPNAVNVGSVLRIKELVRVSLVQSVPNCTAPRFPKGYRVVGTERPLPTPQ